MTQPPIAQSSIGSGEPVLLLNGGMMTMMAWEPIAAALSSEYRVIRCDLRGQLMSPGEPHATFEEHVEDVVGVLDRSGVQDAHVIGTSLGAMVGIVMAASHPERVRSLVAATATDYMSPEEWAAGQPLVEACHRAAEGTGDGGRVLDLLVPLTFSERYVEQNRATLDARRQVVASLPTSYFSGLTGILALMERLDLRRYFTRVHCPLLVVAADQDRMFPPERSRAIASAITGARLEVLSDAAHGVFVEEPGRVLPLLREFLETVRKAPAR